MSQVQAHSTGRDIFITVKAINRLVSLEFLDAFLDTSVVQMSPREVAMFLALIMHLGQAKHLA